MPWVSRDINDNLSFTPIFRAEYVLFQGFPQMSSDLGCLNLARRRTESYLKLWEDSAQGFSWWGCLWNLKIFLPVPSPVLQRMPPISCLDNVFLDAFLDMKSRVPGLHLSSVNSLPLGRKPNPLTGLNISVSWAPLFYHFQLPLFILHLVDTHNILNSQTIKSFSSMTQVTSWPSLFLV